MINLEIKQNRNNFLFFADTFLFKTLAFCIIGGVIIFCFYPIYSIFLTSFFENDRFTLKFYEGIFVQNYFLLKNTLITSTISAICSTFLGALIAFYMIFSNKKIEKFFYYLLLLTMISPPFTFGISYITLFGRRGLITYRLFGLSLNPYGLKGIVILQIIGELSFATFMLVEMLKKIDYNLINVSRSLGASPWETIKRVIIPLSIPAFIGTFFILFTKNLADFGSAIIVGGKYSTLATEAYLTVIGEGNLSRASAMTLLLVFPALILFLLYKKILNKNSLLSFQGKGINLNNTSFKLPAIIKFFITIVSWAFFLIMFLQYTAIFFSGFYNYTSKGIVFTLEYLERFNLSTYKVFLRSIIYALISGFLSASIGILISYYSQRKKIRGIKIIEFLASLPYIIPGTFFGLGYILAFNRGILTLTGTSAIVVLNCTFRQLSIGTKAGDNIFTKLNPNIERAAQDLGASKMGILFNIIFPLLKPAFLVSFVNCFVATMTTIGSIIFLISPGANVATVVLFNSISQGEYGLASIIALAITLVTFSLNIIVIKFFKN